jgi:hypothetical protein
MIHELRSYKLVPAHMAEFLALTRDVAMPIRLSHSKLLGYWTVDVGALNEVWSLWEYDSFAHRSRVRAALGADAAWARDFLARSKPWSMGETSTILNPTDLCAVQPVTGNGVYELRSYQIAPGRMKEWLSVFGEGLSARRKYSAPLGVWVSELGELNHVFHLWGYKDLEARHEIRKAVAGDAAWGRAVAALAPMTQSQHSKVLLPTAWSPFR